MFIFSGTNGTAEKHVKFALCKLADCMCAACARIEHLPKLTLCSDVQL